MRIGTRKIATGRVTKVRDRKHDFEVGYLTFNDMDTMADTCCAGKNWRMIVDTGFTCDVFPFKDGYEAEKNVPVGTCATLITIGQGSEFILIRHEMLYFGKEMERSLLNQNQIRHHIRHNKGFIQDDFTREDEELGIMTAGNGEVFIPFQLAGTALHFESRVPSDEEYDTLPHIIITSGDAWDPKTVRLRKISSDNRPQDRRVRDYETDIHLGSISSALLEKESSERMISSVRIADKTTAAVISNDCHSKVTAKNVSRIWGIGLDTAHKTLRVTTQQGVRTALHPITKRYRVDHLNLHCKRLNSAFYTDTLFSKVQSLSGNKCAQLFTNGEYTALYPSTSKANAGKALGDFTEDVGIPEELTADLAGETTGKNTEFMKHVYDLRIKMHWAEKGRKNQNHKAERKIGILKQRWQRRMARKQVPMSLIHISEPTKPY